MIIIETFLSIEKKSIGILYRSRIYEILRFVERSLSIPGKSIYFFDVPEKFSRREEDGNKCLKLYDGVIDEVARRNDKQLIQVGWAYTTW